MTRLPASLTIAIWIVGSLWAVAIAAHLLDAPREIVYGAAAVGLVMGIVEWLMIRAD
jgi:hypothetical protein